MNWQAEVNVWLKPSVFDPQGNAVEQALAGLGHEGIDNVRIGKYMSLTVNAATRAEAEEKLRVICDTVLCNPVMETYAFSLEPVTEEAGA